MTITNENTENLFNGTGVTTVFATNIYAFTADQVFVYIRENGIDTLKTLTTHYTLTNLDVPAGVTVTMLIAPTATQKLVVVRGTPKTQELNLTSTRAYNPEALMDALDRVVMMMQEVTNKIARSFKVKPGLGTPTETTDPDALANLVTFAASASASATAAAASAGQAALFDGPWLANVAALLANTSLTYTTGTSSSVAVGSFVRTREEGFAYRVAAAAATDHHVATAGGVKLYVLAGAGGFNAKAFGARGDDATDDTAALAKWVVACQNRAGFLPAGIYRHTGLTFLPQFSYNIEGEVYDNHAVGGSVLKNTNALGGHAISINNTPFTGNFDSQIRFTNLTVKGNALSGDGFNVDQCMVYLENVWITGNGRHGYWAQRCYSSAFRQVSFSNNRQNGFIAVRALNAVHFDHCLFNGNGEVDGAAGCALGGAGGVDRNFGVTFTACDFTGNGALLAVGTVFGLAVQQSASVALQGCYFEGNKTFNLYADSTASNVSVRECFLQDSKTELLQVNGLVFENNLCFDNGGLKTQLTIDGGIGTGRFPHRIFGTQFSGTVAKNLFGGATEATHFLHSAVPTVGTWKVGDVVWNSNFQQGGQTPGWICAVAGTPGTWIPIGQVPHVFQNHGDAAATLTVFSSFPTNLWQSPLTANRFVTLSTTNAFSGAKFRIVRSAGATGAFDLNVGGLKILTAGQWCEVEFDGAAWRLTAFGSL